MYTRKDKLKVMVCTPLYRVEGVIHLLPGSRLTDIINIKAGKDFIPITDAKVYAATNDKVLYQTDFVSINRESIIMLFPLEGVEGVSKKRARRTGKPRRSSKSG